MKEDYVKTPGEYKKWLSSEFLLCTYLEAFSVLFYSEKKGLCIQRTTAYKDNNILPYLSIEIIILSYQKQGVGNFYMEISESLHLRYNAFLECSLLIDTTLFRIKSFSLLILWESYYWLNDGFIIEIMLYPTLYIEACWKRLWFCLIAPMNTTDIYSQCAEWIFFLYLGSSFKNGFFWNLIRAQEIPCTLQLATKERTFILKSSSQFLFFFFKDEIHVFCSIRFHTH